ncbi:MAG: nitrate reductase cytochrome c-type subunit [Sulfurospirillum sp.]|nr:nitrate reductase cytochrome c-type subunit [Sulfurospirillum sp.]
MFSKKTWIISVAMLAFIVSGCAVVGNAYHEEELGLRKVDLYSEKTVVPDATDYTQAAAGESKLIQRSFENAPPMIPHDIEGMLPITGDYNSCLGCHDPAVAKDVQATPTPLSHLASFRPLTQLGANGEVIKEGKIIRNSTDVLTAMHKREGVSMERYNCSACHVPQSNNEPLVANEFQPDFRSKNGISSSNLIDNLNEGIK